MDLEQLRKHSTEAFVIAATSGRCSHARALLAARPEIASDRWARLVLGGGWDGDPGAAGGPPEWLPLVYVCHSCFASSDLALRLLDAGADPNSYFVDEHGRMSALYGAAGVRHDPDLTRWFGVAETVRALLARGADADVRADVEFATPLGWAALDPAGTRCRGATTSPSRSCCATPAPRSSRDFWGCPRDRSTPGWLNASERAVAVTV